MEPNIAGKTLKKLLQLGVEQGWSSIKELEQQRSLSSKGAGAAKKLEQHKGAGAA
jgi:hypothetical protein